MDYSLPGASDHGDYPSKNPGVGLFFRQFQHLGIPNRVPAAQADSYEAELAQEP